MGFRYCPHCGEQLYFEKVEVDIRNYTRNRPTFYDWLTQRVQKVDGAKERMRDLRADFLNWSEEQGLDKILSVRQFSDCWHTVRVELVRKTPGNEKYVIGVLLKTSPLSPDQTAQDVGTLFDADRWD